MGKRLPEIKQREDGRYEIKVTVGRNKRRSVYGKTEAEVRKKARQLLEEATKFNLSNISKMTVRTYMTNWLLTVKKPDLKPGSYDRVEQSVNYQILPYIGDIQISALNANDIQNMINELLVKLSYSTVKKAYNNLNACMELAVIRGEIVKNPVKGVRLPSAKNKEKKNVTAYTPEEIAAIVEEAKRTYSNGAPAYRYGYLIILLLNTGMREGEPLYLKWEDVDLEKRRLYVHGNVVEVKNREKNAASKYVIIEQETPKTDKSTRYIPLNDNAIDALEHLRSIIRDNHHVIATKNHKSVLNYTLESIKDPATFELFDYKFKDLPVFVDFKNWHETTRFSENEVISKVIRKAKECKAECVIIANILARDNYSTKVSHIDGITLVCCPSLMIDNNSSVDVNIDAADKIRRCIENVKNTHE